jgi:hypothetical protein
VSSHALKQVLLVETSLPLILPSVENHSLSPLFMLEKEFEKSKGQALFLAEDFCLINEAPTICPASHSTKLVRNSPAQAWRRFLNFGIDSLSLIF